MNSEKTVNKGRINFWCLLGILILLIMTRYSFQINIPRPVFLIVIGLMALLGDRDEILATCICCIPMHESIDFFYALAICVCVYIFKYYKNIRIGTNVLILFIIAVWELLHCFQTSFSVVDFLTCIIPLVVLVIVSMSDAKELDYPFIVRAFAWATLGISLVLFIKVLYFAGFDIALALAGLQRLGSDMHSNIEGVTIAGNEINPNTLGIITVLASTGLMQLRSMKVARKIDMILMCAIIIFAALGTSRTYLACLALMILLLIFSEKGGAAKRFRLIALLLLTIVIVVVAFALLFPDTFTFFISRFFVDDITTGRDNLMVRYHNFIVGNPNVLFFGIGLQDFGDKLINFYKVASNITHNFIQEIVLAWGIPGLVLIASLFICMHRHSSKRNKNRSLINWIPLIIILFKGMAGQLLTSSYTMLALSFAYLSLSVNMTPDESLEQIDDTDDTVEITEMI